MQKLFDGVTFLMIKLAELKYAMGRRRKKK